MERLSTFDGRSLHETGNWPKCILRTLMATHFKTQSDVLRLPAPTDKDSAEYWHEHTKGFGVRVHRANAAGAVRRAYIARYSLVEPLPGNPGETRKKDVKKVLGTLDELSFDDALDKATALRRAAPHKRKTGEDPVPTLRVIATTSALTGCGGGGGSSSPAPEGNSGPVFNPPNNTTQGVTFVAPQTSATAPTR